MRHTPSFLSLFLSLLLLAPAFAAGPTATKGRILEPKEFDRLDGHGATAKRVDVIEWENNLEIHVYPKGGLRSLGMKVDRTKKDKPVMVIEYGFTGVPYTLIRRALLSIPMKDGFKTYRDATAADYDKIIISNNTLSDGVETFALAPEPTQIYPDYHPALAEEAAKTYNQPASSGETRERQPSSATANPPRIQFRSAEEVEQDARGTTRKREREPSTVDEDGGIKNFAF